VLAPLEDLEKATHQSRGARHFVRLHRISDGDAKLVLVVYKRRREVSPQAFHPRFASGRWVVCGESLSPPVENDPMDGAHEAQSESRREGIALSCAKDLPDDAASFGVGHRSGEQAGVERRSQDAALVCLPSQLARDLQSCAGVSHTPPQIRV
jgi:hypothetical protein